MSPDPHNPPVPGKGIDAKPIEPPYNSAARGESQPKPEVLQHNLNLKPQVSSLTPDGRTVMAGPTEDKRLAAIEARANLVQPGIEKDSAEPANPSKLQRDFDDARHNRQ